MGKLIYIDCGFDISNESLRMIIKLHKQISKLIERNRGSYIYFSRSITTRWYKCNWMVRNTVLNAQMLSEGLLLPFK